jgi:hypothetical protein
MLANVDVCASNVFVLTDVYDNTLKRITVLQIQYVLYSTTNFQLIYYNCKRWISNNENNNNNNNNDNNTILSSSS